VLTSYEVGKDNYRLENDRDSKSMERVDVREDGEYCISDQPARG
jgi:hypothetical protein